jgi:hypothetical protein
MAVVALAFAAYAIRPQLERALIAASIYHAHNIHCSVTDHQ